MNRYTPTEIIAIRNRARNERLEAALPFWTESPDTLTRICNGCGAEDAPQWVRDALTWIYRNYTPGHCIHDVDYEESDGSEFSKAVADGRFNRNNLTIWRNRYGAYRWMNPVALWDRNKIRLAYKAVRKWGNGAWQKAYQRNLAREVAEND